MVNLTTVNSMFHLQSGMVNSNTVNSKFHYFEGHLTGI